MKKYIFAFFLIAEAFSIYAQWQPDFRLTNHPDSSLTPQNNARCILANGNIIHIVWFDNRDGNYEIYYKRSVDEGTAWSTDTRLTNDIGVSNRPALALSGNYVHLVWNDRVSNEEIYYKQSTDGGISWGSSVRLTNDGANSNFPSVYSSGNVVIVTWSENRDGNYEIYYKRSTDNGVSWGADLRLTNDPAVSLQPGCAFSGSVVHLCWHDNRDGNNEIYYKRSSDLGVTWGSDTRLTNMAGTSFFPVIDAAMQNVFISWVEDSDGNPEIYTKRSSDFGLTWEANQRQTNNPGISIRPTLSFSGLNIHLVWQDNIDGNDEIYYKYSSNAGISFSANQRLTENQSFSVYPCHTVSASGVHAVWRDFRDGNWEVYYKRNPIGNLTNLQCISGGTPDKFSLSQNYPNPFNPVTNIAFSIQKSSFVKLTIFDALAGNVAVLMNQKLEPGNYITNWDASNFSSGVYLYKLETDEFAEIRKMILLK